MTNLFIMDYIETDHQWIKTSSIGMRKKRMHGLISMTFSQW